MGRPVTPTVSVIIATYNRSRVLRHAIESVRNSRYSDWELIVVGDACTDDTAACVAAFDDSRIRFVNLPERCGDQSGPNNHGIALSRGRYVAFLNHDDFYLPDHLSACVATLEAGDADFVWAPCAIASPRSGSPDGPPLSFTLEAVPLDGVYTPLATYYASCWMFRRELADRVGPWRLPGKMFVVPSQDWLFRAWRSGAKLQFLRSAGVVVVSAGAREGSYLEADSSEHERLAQWFCEDADYRAKILEDAAINEAAKFLLVRRHSKLFWLVRCALARPIYALSLMAGIHPGSATMMLNYGGRGGFVRYLRKRTGVNASSDPA